MQYGNRHARRKLTPHEVEMVRDLHLKKQFAIAYLNKNYSAAGLAKKLGVHVRTIEKVLNFETWNG